MAESQMHDAHKWHRFNDSTYITSYKSANMKGTKSCQRDTTQDTGNLGYQGIDKLLCC